MGDGSVRCWGRGTEGQLGNNAASTLYSPVKPGPGARAAAKLHVPAIADGTSSCDDAAAPSPPRTGRAAR